MRIALLTFEYPPETGSGDQALYAYYHARALARAGHEVQVFAGAASTEDRTVWDGSVAVSRFHRDGRVQAFGSKLGGLGLRRVGRRMAQGADTITALLREHRNKPFDVIEVGAIGGEAPLLALGSDLPIVVRLDSGPISASATDDRALDRLITRAVENIGIEGAASVSASSQWILNQVSRRVRLQRPAVVIPNGIELTAFDEPHGRDIESTFEISEDQFVIFCPDVQDDPQQRYLLGELVLDMLNRHTEQIVFAFAGQSERRAITEQLADELPPDQLEQGIRDFDILGLGDRVALMKRADVVLLSATRQSCPMAALEAMAAGRPILAPDSGGVGEILRAEVDGLLARAADVPSFRGELNLLIRNEDLRRGLGRSARKRVEAEFQADAIAARTIAFHSFSVATTRPTPVATREPARLFGPDDWFEMWWLDRSRRVTPAMALDANGQPTFSSISLDEFRFIDTIVTRVWVEEQANWNTPEWRFAKQIHELYLDRTARERETEVPEATLKINLPPLTHPLFEETRATYFVDEMWRIEGRAEFREWLAKEILAPGFAEQAAHRIHLRRLAVASAMHGPSLEIYRVLGEIYRRDPSCDRVIRQDRAFFESHARGPDFATQIERLGLHAPMNRPRLFPKRRKSKKSDSYSVSNPAKVTVLIPAYKHEAFIEEAIESVASQTMTDLAILVVDDQSPDGTLKAARRVKDPRLTVRKNESNLGLGKSIREAVAKIKSPYVALLNSDDAFHPDRLEQCIAVLESDPGADLVATGLFFMDGEGRRLTRETSCAVESGPQTHAWLEWYETLAEKLQEPADWIDLPLLLRHNHLATSSNIVLRREFLAEHIATGEQLKYCVDWLLFLIAAMDGKLRYVPNPLVAYRFHSSNTVWFEEGRSDYVLEVNEVVCHILRRMWQDLRKKDPVAAREEVARLLREHASQHGETDGFVLYLGELTRQLGSRGNTETGSELDLFAESALERKTLEQVMERIDIPPWDLVGLSQQQRRHRIDAHVAEAFLTQSRQQASELYNLRRHAEDEAVLRAKSERERDALRREHTVLRNENLILEQTRARLAGETHRLRSALDAERAWTRQAVDSLAEEKREHEEEMAETANRIADVQRGHEQDVEKARDRQRQLEESTRELEQEIARLVERLRETDSEVARLTEELADERTETAASLSALQRQSAEDLAAQKRESDEQLAEILNRTTNQLAARESRVEESLADLRRQSALHLEDLQRQHERELNEITELVAVRQREHQAALARFKDEQNRLARQRLSRERHGRDQLIEMMQQMHADNEGRLRHLTHTHEWRAGRFLLQKLKLRGLWKTMVRSQVRWQVGWQRTRARFNSGGKHKIALVCDGAFPARDRDSVAWEARGLLDAGFDIQIICWGAGSKTLLRKNDQDLTHRRHVLFLDESLQRRDRGRFERRVPEIVAAISELQEDVWETLLKTFSLARSAQLMGARYLHAVGTAEAAIMAHGAAKLLGIPYGVVVAGRDIPALVRDRDRTKVVLREASMIMADCRTTAESVRAAFDIELPQLATKPPTVYWEREKAAASNGRLLAAVSPTPSAEELLVLAEAVKQAVELGADLGIDIREGVGARDALAILQHRVNELGLQDRFTFHGDGESGSFGGVLETSSVLVSTLQRDSDCDRFGLPAEALAAMAAGMPIVASWGTAMGDVVRDEKDGLLVTAEDSGDLATALKRLAQNHDLRQSLGNAARKRFLAEYAPDITMIDLRRRLKKLLSQ